jgi:hypothetical protein
MANGELYVRGRKSEIHMNLMRFWRAFPAPLRTCGPIMTGRNLWAFAALVGLVARFLSAASALLNRVAGEVNLGSR